MHKKLSRDAIYLSFFQPIFQLQCRHIFCFLCVKGVALSGVRNRCPMCRREIPPDYLDHPDLVQGPVEAVVSESCSLTRGGVDVDGGDDDDEEEAEACGPSEEPR